MRVPDMALIAAEPERAATLADAAERWQASRIDVAEATRIQHRTALRRALPLLGSRTVDDLGPRDMADLVAHLDGLGKSRESIRKTLPPWRWCSTMPASRRILPATAWTSGCLARSRSSSNRRRPRRSRPCSRCCPRATGCRGCGSTGRGRASRRSGRSVSVTTTSRAAESGCGRPRQKTDRPLGRAARRARRGNRGDPAAPRGSRPRRARVRGRGRPSADVDRQGVPRRGDPAVLAARPTAPPHLASPSGGTPWAGIGRFVGQRSLTVTADTYTHVLVDGREINTARLLRLRT